MSGPQHISGLQQSTKDRFDEMKHEARKRMGRKQLTHDEFVGLLLDVYEFHLDLKTDLEAAQEAKR